VVVVVVWWKRRRRRRRKRRRYEYKVIFLGTGQASNVVQYIPTVASSFSCVNNEGPRKREEGMKGRGGSGGEKRGKGRKEEIPIM